MNYNNVYVQLIYNAYNRELEDCYVECHHVIPKSEGGKDTKDNLVNLTAREHYIAHLLLAKIYDDYAMHAAVIFMQTGRHKSRDFKFNSHLYEKLRHAFSEKSHSRKVSAETRKKISEHSSSRRPEVRKKLSAAKSGNNNPMFGRRHSDATKKALSEKAHIESAGRHWWNNGKTDVFEKECPAGFVCGRLSAAGSKNGMHGRKHSEHSRKKMSEALRGRHLSEEARRMMSIERTGKHWFTDGVVNRFAKKCPEGFHCGRTCR